MFVATDLQREAAFNDRVVGLIVGALNRTGCQESVVGGVKGYGAKLLPVADDGFLRQNLVERDLALPKRVVSS